MDKYFLLLQMNDAFFPIGAYAHSYGLETYVQEGVIHHRESAEHWLQRYLRCSLLYSGLLSVRLSYEAAQAYDIPALQHLEQRLRSGRSARELREAAAKLGLRLVKTLQAILPSEQQPVVEDYLAACLPQGISHSAAYGVFCAAAGIDKRDALAHYLYAQTSGMVTTCVKLVPLAQTDGQCMLLALTGSFREILDQAEVCQEMDLCRSAPGLDIRSMQHEVLYSRLYMS